MPAIYPLVLLQFHSPSIRSQRRTERKFSYRTMPKCLVNYEELPDELCESRCLHTKGHVCHISRIYFWIFRALASFSLCSSCVSSNLRIFIKNFIINIAIMITVPHAMTLSSILSTSIVDGVFCISFLLRLMLRLVSSFAMEII
jgi:hypothetical protein